MVIGQNCIVEGRVFNALNNNSLDFAKVQVVNMQKGAITDAEGLFSYRRFGAWCVFI